MSETTEQRVLSTMRRMAWSRAKGELESMLDTIYGDPIKHEFLKRAAQEFISHIEGEGLQE